MPPANKPSFPAALLSDLQPRHIIAAAVLIALGAGLSRIINHAFARVVERHRARGTLLPETVTQLALTRRLLVAAVWFTCIGIALTQFEELRALSTGLLASAGLSGLIVGFAARSTLGNAVAGMTLSIAQPIRIGDDIEVKGERGIVEDIHLLFTVVRLFDGKRLIIPNDTLGSEVIKNLTMGGVTRVCRADVLVQPRGDAEAMRQALLEVANGFEGLDRTADGPAVYYIRVNELGTLVRLIATCRDGAAADQLSQRALARGSQLAWRSSLA